MNDEELKAIQLLALNPKRVCELVIDSESKEDAIRNVSSAYGVTVYQASLMIHAPLDQLVANRRRIYFEDGEIES